MEQIEQQQQEQRQSSTIGSSSSICSPVSDPFAFAFSAAADESEAEQLERAIKDSLSYSMM
jgi:hypothetical protein